MRDLQRYSTNMDLANIDFQTQLCKIAYKYGTDKCPQIKHSYTPFYYEYLKNKRNSTKKVLEFGIGHTRRNWHNPQEIPKDKLVPNLQMGASLKMWRDFFPNAQIYGADISPATMFEDKRIKTYLCDETDKKSVAKLVKEIGNDIDIVIDDASHHVEDQIKLAQYLLPLLKKDVIYIIEDVGRSRQIMKTLGTDYNYYIPKIPRKWHGGMIVTIQKKKIT